MNIYLRELKAHQKALIIWIVVMFLFILMGMQEYGSMYANPSKETLLIMEKLPQSIKAIYGMGKLDITSGTDFYGMMHLYLMVMVTIHASMLGANIIAKEEKEKTAEFLMAKPISRKKILTTKYLAGLSIITIFNIFTFMSSIIVLTSMDNNVNIKDLILLDIAMLFLQLLFMTVGFFLAAVMNKPKKSNGLVMTILLSTFFLSIIIDLWDKLSLLSIFTPFKYFDAKEVLPKGELNIYYMFLILIMIFSMLYISYKQYEKRDLQV